MIASSTPALRRGAHSPLPILAAALAALAAAAAMLALALTNPAPAAAAPERVAAQSTGALLHGWVHADGPVSGASVRITTTQGAVLGTGTTNDHGLWIIHTTAAKVPSAFEVHASHGRDHQGAVRDRLVADVVGHRHATPITVNVATTIVDHYRDRYKGTSVRTAERKVAKALGLPTTRNLGFATHHVSSHYSDDLHAELAHKAGGINEYIRTHVVGKVHKGRTHRQREHATALRRAMLTGNPDKHVIKTASTEPGQADIAPLAVGLFIGKAGGGAIVGKLVGIGFDKFLEAVGMPDPTAEAFARIERSLAEIKQQIDAVATQVNQVQHDVDAVNQKLVVADYERSVESLRHLSNAVPVAFRNLQAIAHAKNVREYQAAQAMFLYTVESSPTDSGSSSMTMFRTGLDRVDNVMRSTPGKANARGALRTWTDRTAEGRRYWTVDGQAQLKLAWDDWSAVQVQLLAVNAAYHKARGFKDDAGNPVPQSVVAGWQSDWGSLQSPRFTKWITEAGLGELRQLNEGVLYDKGTNRIVNTQYAGGARPWQSGGTLSPVPALLEHVKDPSANWHLPSAAEIDATLRNATPAFPNKWTTPEEAIIAQGGPSTMVSGGSDRRMWRADFWTTDEHPNARDHGYRPTDTQHKRTVALDGNMHNNGPFSAACTLNCPADYWRWFSKVSYSYQSGTHFWPSRAYPNASVLFVADTVDGKGLVPAQFSGTY